MNYLAELSISFLIALLIYFFIIGSCLGSFFNALYYRISAQIQNQNYLCQHDLTNRTDKEKLNDSFLNLPSNLIWIKILFSPSSCPHCKTKIKLIHNIPLVSYFYLKKKCFNCKKTIHFSYPLLELFFALLASLILLIYLSNQQFTTTHGVFSYFFIFIVLLISLIDIKTHKISDDLNYLLLYSGLLLSVFNIWISAKESILAVLLTYLTLKIISQVYYLIRKKNGIGSGDILFFSAIAAWFGMFSIFWIISIASFLAIIYSLVYQKVKNKKIDYQARLSFAPFISLASLCYSLILLIYTT